MEANDELSEDDNVSVYDIRRYLLSSLDFAEDFAHNQREPVINAPTVSTH